MDTTPLTPEATATLEQTNSVATLHIAGEWTLNNFTELLEHKQPSLDQKVQSLVVDGTGLRALDTIGAWQLIQYIGQLSESKNTIQWEGFSEAHKKILATVQRIKPENEKRNTPHYSQQILTDIGKATVRSLREIRALIEFFGRLCATFANTLMHPSKLRFKSVVYHMNDVGIRAMPIVMLMAFLISIVLGYQGATQLTKFGATAFTINLVAISILREMGVLITAIMVAGRSSSAFAAQIGVMKMNDEVAALRTLGLDPFELLILPRMIAIVIMLPILTFLADLAGLAGTFFMGSTLLDMSLLECAQRLKGAINSHTFYIGLVKAPVFAVLIGMVGCLQGLQVKNSATELGARTTQAVVQSIFLVLLADALFSVFFTMAGL